MRGSYLEIWLFFGVHSTYRAYRDVVSLQNLLEKIVNFNPSLSKNYRDCVLYISMFPLLLPGYAITMILRAKSKRLVQNQFLGRRINCGDLRQFSGVGV